MSQEVIEINDLPKEELIKYLTDNGFIQSGDTFTKSEKVTTGKMIMNGREILKTEDINITIEYIGDTLIEDINKSVKGHQLRLSVNGNDLEFIINTKKDLHDFLGLNVGELENKVNNKTRIVEDIL